MRGIIIFLSIVFLNLNAFAQDVLFADLDTNIINLNQSGYFENHGQISSDIFICNGCEMYLRNTGDMSGVIYIGDKSLLTQVINTHDDITYLNTIGSKFVINVQSKDLLKIAEIMHIAGNADKIIFDNSLLLLNAPITNIEIELIGKNVIQLDDARKFNGTAILSNVSGDGILDVYVPGLDSLQTAGTVRMDDSIYLYIKRETDYQKILGNSQGRFINSFRSSSNQRMINAMDRAGSMSDLQDIINRSVSLNPINLMRPIRAFNNFEINSFKHFYNSTASGVESTYITSSAVDLHMGKVYVSADFDNLHFVLSGYIGELETVDDINEFSGVLYGGNLRAYFDDKSLWIDSTVGFTMSSFKTDAIFTNHGSVYNPDGISVYGVLDSGINFDINDRFYISPMVGIGAEYEKVLHQSDSYIFLRAGGIVGFHLESISIKYDYQLFANVETDGTKNIGTQMDVWSVSDFMGGNISYMLGENEVFGVMHKISANIKFMF